MNEQQVNDLVEKIMRKLKDKDFLGNNKSQVDLNTEDNREKLFFPVEVSARHIHLSEAHMKALFGDQEVAIKKELSQPGQFQADIRVTLIGPKGVLQNIAVLGPSRQNTQLELSMTDARVLGLNPPVRDSGDIIGSSGVIVSANGKAIELMEGVIIAKRHIHMTPEDARCRQVEDKELVQVRINGDRPLIFDDVLVRVSDRYRLAMHIDFDEANACGYRSETKGIIVGKERSLGRANPEEQREEIDQQVKQTTVTLNQKVITETLLKEHWKMEISRLEISRTSIVTPLAMDFIREHNIKMKRI